MGLVFRRIKQLCGSLLTGSSNEKSLSVVPLRDHPLMSYRGMRNWPPIWGCGPTYATECITGEVGVLRHVTRHYLVPLRCFLYMELEGRTYTGALLFDDAVFCEQIFDLLETCVGRSIKEIGDLDVSQTSESIFATRENEVTGNQKPNVPSEERYRYS